MVYNASCVQKHSVRFCLVTNFVGTVGTVCLACRMIGCHRTEHQQISAGPKLCRHIFAGVSKFNHISATLKELN